MIRKEVRCHAIENGAGIGADMQNDVENAAIAKLE
jgi:hypothetical protein